MFTKGFWKWVLVGGLVSSTFLGAKAQSIKELEKDCQSGNPNACAKLRYIYVEVGDTQKNRPKRADTETQYIKELEKACRKGDAKSCMELGDMYAEGKGVPQDYTKAITLHRPRLQRTGLNLPFQGWLSPNLPLHLESQPPQAYSLHSKGFLTFARLFSLSLPLYELHRLLWAPANHTGLWRALRNFEESWQIKQ